MNGSVKENRNIYGSIVLLLPFTGVNSALTPGIIDIIKYYIETVQIKRWRLIIEDTKSEEIVFKNAIEKYYKQGIKYFIGGITSTEVSIWNENYGNMDMVLISIASTAILEKRGGNVIRLVASDDVTANVIYTYLTGLKINERSIGIIAAETAYGISLSNEIQKLYQNRLTNIEYYNNDTLKSKSNDIFSKNLAYIVIIGSGEVADIWKLKGNNKSICILPDFTYNNNLFSWNNLDQLLTTGYIGASTITNLDRTDFQTKLWNKYNFYANTFELNIYDVLLFFDLLIDNYYPSSLLIQYMSKYYGITGNFHFNLSKDRNNDSLSISNIIPYNGYYIWQDISYSALKNSVYSSVDSTQILSSFPPLSPITLSTSPNIMWNTLTLTNLNGMSYTFSKYNYPFHYVVTMTLNLSSSLFNITSPPTASNSTNVSISIINNKTGTIDVQVQSGNNRIIIL